MGQNGDTALHIACYNGRLNVIDCLLSEGADVNIKNNDGNGPLDVCRGSSKEKVISLFNKPDPKQSEIIIITTFNDNNDQLIITFNSPSPIAPKPNAKSSTSANYNYILKFIYFYSFVCYYRSPYTCCYSSSNSTKTCYKEKYTIY